jgi:ethanolamine permease
MRKVVGDNALLSHLLITIGLFGLVASFHGLILAAGRSTFEFGKAGLAPKFLGHIQPIVKTPDYALIANMCIGIMLLITNKTGDIIIISVLGALTLYMLAMLSLIALRRKDPNTHRPYRVPGYPFVPALAMVLAMVTFVLIGIYWIKLMLIYLGILLICFIVYKIFYKK